MEGTSLVLKLAVSHSKAATPILFWLIILPVVISLSACGSDSSPAGSTTSGDGYITYDAFPGTTISTTKWTQDDVDAGGTVSIVNNAFRAELIANGSLLKNNARLGMTAAGNPGSVTGIEVKVNVSEATETSGSFKIKARLQGTFYNDGTLAGAAPGSFISDILPLIEILDFRGTTTGFAKYIVFRCTDLDCITASTVAFGSLGNVQLSEDHTFRIEFDRTTSTITFTMDNATVVTLDAAVLGAAFSAGPNFPHVKIGIRGRANPVGTMTATFDDFRCKGCTLP